MTQSEVNQALIESVIPIPSHLEQKIRLLHKYADSIIKIVTFLAATNLLIITLCGIKFGALCSGKIVVIEVMAGLATTCLAVVYFHKLIMELLMQAEETADLARGQAFVELNMAREELVRLRHKLRRDTDSEGYANVNELLKMVSPLVMMFVQKEKNIFRWGMFGWKVAQNAMAVIKHRSKES